MYGVLLDLGFLQPGERSNGNENKRDTRANVGKGSEENPRGGVECGRRRENPYERDPGLIHV